MVTRKTIDNYIKSKDTYWKCYYRGLTCEFWLYPEENVAEYRIEKPDNFPENNVPTIAKAEIKEQMCERDDIRCTQLTFKRR